MQCVQCWQEIKRFDIKCSVCNEIFCSYECLKDHESDVKFRNEMLEFQDEYPVKNEPFGSYPWEQ